jgi:hypothetical protein
MKVALLAVVLGTYVSVSEAVPIVEPQALPLVQSVRFHFLSKLDLTVSRTNYEGFFYVPSSSREAKYCKILLMQRKVETDISAPLVTTLL